MLSIKRLFQIVLIIVTISIAFMLVNINYGALNSAQVINQYDLGLHIEDNAIPNHVQSFSYYLISSEDSTSSKAISDNLGNALEIMGHDYVNKEFIIEDDLVHKPILLFCDAKVSTSIDLKLLVDYIQNGGLVMFAGGIPENFNDSYLYPIWGIIEKGNVLTENTFQIKSDFLPYDEVEVTYSGYNASTSVKVTDDVNVLMKGKSNIPLVYSKVYKNGKIVVINGTFMENRNSGGIFSGALGELTSQLVYPIIGTKTVFLDGLSVMNEYDDKLVSKIYGRSSVSFIRDVLLPAFLENGLLYELKYTTTIKVINDDDFQHGLSDERQLIYLIRKINQYDGEIMFREDYYKSNNNNRSYNEFKNIISRLYPSYQVHGYGIRSGKPSDKMRDIIKENFPTVSIINGVFYGDESKEVVQNFTYKNDYVQFPIISSGYTKENGSYYNLIAGLSLMGVVSHSFDIEPITIPQSDDNSWDALKDDFSEVNKDYFGKTTWLETATISESAKWTKAYSLLETKTSYEEDKVIIYCNQFAKGQKFYLRTNKKIKDIEGGTIKKINEVYYCIVGEKTKITVFYE